MQTNHKGGTPNSTCGRAERGSRKQLQDYVNEHEAKLTDSVIAVLPSRLRELGARIRWVSPIAQDNFIEYRDAGFLRVVGLGDHVDELARFWPSGGPSWDALGIISDSQARIRPGVILVEAKSHISEIYGSGCQASVTSRERIHSSLALTKTWCGVHADANWIGRLYQSGNRLAHLYFIREGVQHPAWLVNLYFTNDPIGPADQDTWRAELEKVKASLGLTSPLPYAFDIFLPALTTSDHSDSLCGSSRGQGPVDRSRR